MKTRLNTSFLGWRQRIVVSPVCSLQSPASSLRPVHAFTLVELLVVIAIVVLALGVVLPTLGSFFNSARAPDARNLISAYLAGARNYAVANNVTTALVFVEHNNGDLDRTLMFLAESSDGSNFTPVPGREATHLPNNIMVTDDPTEAIAFCFLPAGQLTTLAIAPANVDWPVDAPTSVESVKELDLYDYVISDEDPEEHLYINYYTGTVIEQ